MVMLLGISVSAGIHLAPKKNTAADDITYELGATGNVLVWQFDADEGQDDPSTYTVQIDNVDLEGHIDASWQNNVDITVNVDGLAVGEHVALITVNDTGSDANLAPAATDIAIVTVTEVGGATTTSEETTSEDTTTSTTTTEQTTTEPTSDDDTPLNWNFVLIGFMGLMMYKRRIK